ncbi:MAG: TatD family hydrolase [Saprospiraceae bacterium]|nr:TatD family hydrolase [Saprospiraceae bacterium]
MSNFFIDTHSHMYVSKFNKDRKEAIQRAFDSGVQKIFLPNIDRASIPEMLDLEAEFPDQCYAMMGLHPCSVDKNYEKTLALIEKWLDKRPFCAIGEIGLDYYWSTEFVKEQQEAFRTQCRWAKERDLPIVIHARNSLDDLIKIVAEEKTDNFRGIFHCFGGTLEQAQQIIDLGFLMGIGGVATYKKAGLDKVLPHVDLKHLVLETDAPYLSPVPFRGKRNESSYIPYIAQRVADIKEINIEEVATITTQNALDLFGVEVSA